VSAQVTYGDRVAQKIDEDSPVPPYRQVAAILRGQIESGDLAPGRRLPSIADLVQTYGIARTTAAKALRVLIDEGLAEVSPGMGTYVRRGGQPGQR
jgi:DNA-binding GntR family transcriptional regulator